MVRVLRGISPQRALYSAPCTFIGIWDCLTSQTAVDCVRYLIFQGYKLPEVCERLLDHLIAPDTDSDSPVGCDNMTILIVALLNGRSEEEWYAWVSDRAKQNAEFQRLPQLYADHRLTKFEKRRQLMEERERQRQNDAAEAAAELGSGSMTPTQVVESTPASRFLGQHELTSRAFA